MALSACTHLPPLSGATVRAAVLVRNCSADPTVKGAVTWVTTPAATWLDNDCPGNQFRLLYRTGEKRYTEYGRRGRQVASMSAVDLNARDPLARGSKVSAEERAPAKTTDLPVSALEVTAVSMASAMRKASMKPASGFMASEYGVRCRLFDFAFERSEGKGCLARVDSFGARAEDFAPFAEARQVFSGLVGATFDSMDMTRTVDGVTYVFERFLFGEKGKSRVAFAPLRSASTRDVPAEMFDAAYIRQDFQKAL